MLGKKVRDKVTGFVGVVIARTEWLNGCLRYNVQGPIDKDGKIPESEYIDGDQLEVIEERQQPVSATAVGGPQRNEQKKF